MPLPGPDPSCADAAPAPSVEEPGSLRAFAAATSAALRDPLTVILARVHVLTTHLHSGGPVDVERLLTGLDAIAQQADRASTAIARLARGIHERGARTASGPR